MRVQLFAFVALAVKTATQVDGLFVDVLSYLYRCRTRDVDECVARDLTRAIDSLMDKNDTFRLNRYLTVTVVGRPAGAGDRGGSVSGNGTGSARVRSDDLTASVLDLFNALQVQYRPEDVFEGQMNVMNVFSNYAICLLRKNQTATSK